MFKFIREYKELRYLAYHDPLTKLYNRNWLYKNINKLKRKFVYFIDINDLHKVNKAGHTFGDKHIIKCVDAIKTAKNDYLIRYAGDEFILLTNTTDLKTNELFSVGKCKIKECVNESINLADAEMLKSKSLWKSERGRRNKIKDCTHYT